MTDNNRRTFLKSTVATAIAIGAYSASSGLSEPYSVKGMDALQNEKGEFILGRYPILMIRLSHILMPRRLIFTTHFIMALQSRD